MVREGRADGTLVGGLHSPRGFGRLSKKYLDSLLLGEVGEYVAVLWESLVEVVHTRPCGHPTENPIGS